MDNSNSDGPMCPDCLNYYDLMSYEDKQRIFEWRRKRRQLITEAWIENSKEVKNAETK